MISPYTGNNFFTFFFTLAERLFTGKISSPASDEVQLIVLLLLSLSCAGVGAFLVLKKMTMMANSLSHTILLGIVLSFIFLGGSQEGLSLQVLLIASLLSALATSFLTQLLTQWFRLQEDASIGLVFTTLFALGVVLVTLYTRNLHLGVEAIMGNVDALHVDDISLVAMVAGVNLLILILFFSRLRLFSFDPGLARSYGMNASLYNGLLMALTALTATVAFRAVGVILVLALFVGPPLIARLFTHSLKPLLLIACAVSCTSSLFAVALSRHFLSVHHMALSTSGMNVTLLAMIFVAGCIAKRRA